MPAVTQVIDGIPQVVAPQQLIVSCNPSVLPLLCTSALARVTATVIATGQGVFNLVQLPDLVPLQSALDTLRAASGNTTPTPDATLKSNTA